MIKRDVAYVDFDGNQQTETFWFHITKTVLTDHIVELTAEMNEISYLLEGEKKTLTIPEIVKILAMIKNMVKLAYGEKSPDGKRFRQTEEVWDDFRFSPAYDALLTYFMEHPDEGMQFIEAVLPADLVKQAQEQQEIETTGLTAATEAVRTPDPSTAVQDIGSMSREELEAAFARVRSEQGITG